jgi:thymidylate synthase ThyX
LGHVTVCFEGVSELAAAEIEDEQLWDGQARSSRYQDFSSASAVVPSELTAREKQIYETATDNLLDAYRAVHEQAFQWLHESLPQPPEMKPEAYRRNLRARAFDVARFLLPFGIPTGLGQVTSIRTLEKQIRRLKASEFQELRDLGQELADACANPPECVWENHESSSEPVAATLAKHAAVDEFTGRLRADLSEWAKDHLPRPTASEIRPVDLLQPTDHVADICATLLYPVTNRAFRELYELACAWPPSRRQDLLRLALGGRGHADELPRHFRNAPYVFDFVMDIGAYRDFHRHRRCQQFRQPYTNELGFDIPEAISHFAGKETFSAAIEQANAAIAQLPRPASAYLLPLAAQSRFLFKMDFAELEYISRLRSGLKGHFSYRKIAWEMKLALQKLEPMLGDLIHATPPEVEDPLTR